MSLNDPLANAMSTIFNAQKKAETQCIVYPTSKIVKGVLQIMQDGRYIGGFEETQDARGTYLTIQLIGAINKCGVIKPRFTIKKDGFERFEQRFLVAKDFGILVVSTNQGLMTHNEAKEKGIGGCLLAYCY